MIDVIINALAHDIISGILVDLCDRGGLQEVWESYDEEAQNKIRQDWATIAFNRLQPDMKDMVHRSE